MSAEPQLFSVMVLCCPPPKILLCSVPRCAINAPLSPLRTVIVVASRYSSSMNRNNNIRSLGGDSRPGDKLVVQYTELITMLRLPGAPPHCVILIGSKEPVKTCTYDRIANVDMKKIGGFQVYLDSKKY